MTAPTAPDADGTASPGPTRQHVFAVPPWLDRAAAWSWRLLLVAAAIGATMFLALRLRLVAVPALVAVLVASLLGPPAAALRRRGWNGLVATWTVLLIAVAVVGGLFVAAIVLVVAELTGGSDQWRRIGDDIRTWLTDDAPIRLSDEQVDDLWSSVRRGAIEGLGGGGDALRLLVEFASGVFLGVVLVFFFVNDGGSMWSWLLARIQPARAEALDAAGRNAVTTLAAYVRGVAITGLVNGVLVGVVLLVLGVPLAVPLAIITFFGAFIPIVGATTAGALAAVVALVTEGVADSIIVAVAVLVIQQVEGDVVMPLVMRRQVRLHPAVVIVAVAGGAAVAGVIGAFAAVPLTAAGVRIVSDIRSSAQRQALQIDAVTPTGLVTPGGPATRAVSLGAERED